MGMPEEIFADIVTTNEFTIDWYYIFVKHDEKEHKDDMCWSNHFCNGQQIISFISKNHMFENSLNVCYMQ